MGWVELIVIVFIGFIIGFLFAFLYNFITRYFGVKKHNNTGILHRARPKPIQNGEYSPQLTSADLAVIESIEFINISTIQDIQNLGNTSDFNIFFVANPYINLVEVNAENEIENIQRIKDDIIGEYKNHFYDTVESCIKSFAINNLMGKSEIFPRLNFYTIYTESAEDTDENALCQNTDIEYLQDVISPRLDDRRFVEEFVRQAQEVANNGNNNNDTNTNLGIVPDLVFLISASKEQIRASAIFSIDGGESTDEVEFKYKLPNSNPGFSQKFYHCKYCKHPGVAALSIWDDRPKTVLHEFAHAISSENNGAIVDEYIDSDSTDDNTYFPLLINRRRRQEQGDAIPNIFSYYNIDDQDVTTYFSDRYRDLGSESVSITPEKPDIKTSCIMDIALYDYHFGELIFDFLYDRMLIKLNRRENNNDTSTS
ncbi:MAG: hypothetical protein HND50_18440 [Calditrichaeota bacterium]|nr:hypothetical protein [Calditrichota bacterium]